MEESRHEPPEGPQAPEAGRDGNGETRQGDDLDAVLGALYDAGAWFRRAVSLYDLPLRTGLSLAAVRAACLRGLREGWLTVAEAPPGRRPAYTLTPRGVARATRLRPRRREPDEDRQID
ncbi:MAG: hypothetical protein QN122_10465 [Armatimonadota bacterium]|nr:hypothetical protein [Armatimonadota bacterium]MDR7449542.1 hypothetical protein [Armatimonadota bacterium]MDR7460064.1 hypothetical protein [Armatimonadota bacterium]MDR7478699.1 hypothetical protein [Armatimonadota bacterium]MDR7487973.1 hypothetical protein [Armatimonadota bacterium]